MDATTPAPSSALSPTPSSASSPAPTYRLPPEAAVTVLDETTVRLRARDASVLFDGDAEDVLAATDSLAGGVPVAVAPEVVEQLWSHGVLRRDDGLPAAELRRARLAMSCLLVDGLSGCGARLAELLVELGVGTVVLRDGTAVTAADEGDHLRPVHHGRRRAEVLTELLRDPGQDSTVLECPPEGGVRGADVQVLVRTGGTAWPAREQLESRLRETPRVLPISVGEQGALLGPVVATGGPAPCPSCLEAHRLGAADGASDSATEGGADRTADTSAPGDQSAPSPLLLGLCAHLAALQLGELLGGQLLPSLTDTAIYVEAATGEIRSQPIPPASDCACRAQSELFGVSPDSPESSDSSASSEPSELEGVAGPS